jgi:FtsP/CotA-like multicopper oxidase with cupredoxin domain
MSKFENLAVSRRAVLIAGGGLALAAAWPRQTLGAARVNTGAGAEYRITAGSGRVPLGGASIPETEVWCYNGRVPGPEIRLRQGERLKVTVENGLNELTSVHWHGLRVPNAMDGVPYLTQDPIEPGGTFVYEFVAPDAGTYFYHPHWRSFEQVGRGLYGPLIVEEREPIEVDRDVLWAIDDWRLTPAGSISDDFGDFRDIGMAGRIGNIMTINGRAPRPFRVRAGERLRLRLINAANARILELNFTGHRPRIVALDGQPVEPHEPAGGRIVLGPAMRADLVIDMTGEPGASFAVTDSFYRRWAYKLLDLVYADEPPLRRAPLEAPIHLPANDLPEPDFERAERHEVTFAGGMMGGMMGGGMMGGRGMGGMMGGRGMGA